MPANKILFADYKKFSPPKRVYLDSNFAIELLYYEINHVNLPALTPRQRDCFSFYQQLVQDGTELLGSVFTFSETLHFYAFLYPKNGMYKLARDFLSSHGAAHVAKLTPQKAFKYFLNTHPIDCDAAWKSISYRVGATEEFFDNYKIKLVHPLPSPELSNITRSVIAFAAVLKDFFVAVESADALHLALASYLNCDALVSLDAGFCSVDGFTIYSAF